MVDVEVQHAPVVVVVVVAAQGWLDIVTTSQHAPLLWTVIAGVVVVPPPTLSISLPVNSLSVCFSIVNIRRLPHQNDSQIALN